MIGSLRICSCLEVGGYIAGEETKSTTDPCNATWASQKKSHASETMSMHRWHILSHGQTKNGKGGAMTNDPPCPAMAFHATEICKSDMVNMGDLT